MNPEIAELEEILNTLLRGIQELLQSGETIPEDFQRAVAQEINALTDRIDILYTEQDQRMPTPEPSEPQGPTPSIEAPVSEGANLLWILSGGQPQAFVSYLREFPDPELTNLLNNPNLLAQTIEQLQRNNPIERTGQEDGIPQAQLQSSNIYGFRFNPRNKKLQVRFQGGALYEYDGVPDQIFNLFSQGNAAARTNGKNDYGQWWRGKNPSLGAALNQYIKQGNYPYRRIR